MAQVLEAVLVGESGFERRVAIKRILPQFANDQQMRRMFLDEARVCGRLHHSNIVQVVDYGTIDGSEFIAMEYVDGADARRACLRGAAAQHPIPQGVALHAIAQVAHALHYAHTLCDDEGQPVRLVHRDISPHNILFSWDGDVKLADFGIALAKLRQEQTRTGVVKGKDGYMAPEQARSQPLTAAADVYALGPTLHAMLCGQPPESRDEGLRLAPELDPRIRQLIETWSAADPWSRPAADQVAESARRLSLQLGDDDPRTSLRKWLTTLRPEFTRRSALEDLHGLAMFADGAHRFAVRQTIAVADPADGNAESSTSAPTRGSPPRTTTSSWTRYLAVGALALAVAVIGLWTVRERQTPPAGSERPQGGRDRPTATANEPPPAGTAGAHVDARNDPKLHRTPDVGPSSVDATTSRAARRTKARRSTLSARRRSSALRSRRHAGSPRVKKKPVSNRHGWLRVGGPSLARTRVEVDGKERGYAPIELQLRQGNHSIVIKRADTRELVLKRTVTIGDHHTRGSPLKMIR